MSLPDFAGLIITATVQMMLFLAWGAASRPKSYKIPKFNNKKRFLQLIDGPSTCIHFDCIDHPRDLIGVLTKKLFFSKVHGSLPLVYFSENSNLKSVESPVVVYGAVWLILTKWDPPTECRPDMVRFVIWLGGGAECCRAALEASIVLAISSS